VTAATSAAVECDKSHRTGTIPTTGAKGHPACEKPPRPPFPAPQVQHSQADGKVDEQLRNCRDERRKLVCLDLEVQVVSGRPAGEPPNRGTGEQNPGLRDHIVAHR
jgi:hypothetical protein